MLISVLGVNREHQDLPTSTAGLGLRGPRILRGVILIHIACWDYLDFTNVCEEMSRKCLLKQLGPVLIANAARPFTLIAASLAQGILSYGLESGGSREFLRCRGGY